ncbi:MAG: hypothetical protein EZS28_014248 [Streblomastix strix]|uniref:Calcineurin-like phosphoesterase domain-containing protein n=1 Tax=Streblomastix strix TaxID=222440 RepID=A0A5J4W6E6_9EUKA|nr:MAG: hypothetical protein EZS28_014248 [Streblomastix strix]
MLIAHLNGLLILRNKKVNLKSSKLKQPLRIIQLSDVHIGTRSKSFLQKVVNRVNELKGDVVCITGDLVDSRGVIQTVGSQDDIHKLDEKSELQPYPIMSPLSNLTAKFGVYFVLGNHDLWCGREGVVKMIQHFPNIHFLSNEYVDITLKEQQTSDLNENQYNKIRVIGIEDGSADQFNEYYNSIIKPDSPFLLSETNESPYTVILHHRPHKKVWLEAMNQLKGDLFLAGHTHNGQIFPVHPVVYFQFPHTTGLLSTKDNKNQQSDIKSNQNVEDQSYSFTRHMYVSSGTGTFATPARSSGFSEITIITITPE